MQKYPHGLTPDNLDKIQRKKNLAMYHMLPSIHDALKSKSPLQQLLDRFTQMSLANSQALKKLQKRSYQNILENCYKPEWMNEEYPNQAAIQKCIQMQEDQVMGVYKAFQFNYMEEGKGKMLKCVNQNQGDHVACINCFENFKTHFDKGSEELRKVLQASYPDIMG